ncbi:fluoride efflux transporter CrcB [Caulobacter sp. S45]|uniref:fluoride efflux transporter CrcB n=1 Tax=Caulobacter sp. S45 TaxID=1641861 RepID=UPI00131B91D1|nr:fluoride efflux transporter CrcB [Caulobacter sp. S45]
MVNLLLVFFAGGVGSVCRYSVGMGYLRTFGTKQPYLATFGINVLGGLLMGMLIGFLALRGGPGQEKLRLLLGVGLLGGFTTFSSFSMETVLMLERKAYGAAAGYVAGSVILSILAVMAGLLIMRKALA